MNKTFLNAEDTRNIIKEVVRDLSELVGATYGPNGSTIIIYGEDGIPYATKDGVSVAKSFYYEDDFKNSIAKLIKQAAIETLEAAGDGTTTSTILISEFINKGLELLHGGTKTIVDIKKEFENLEEVVINKLKGFRIKDVSSSDIYQIGLVSSNNDESIASIVGEAFKHSNNVTIEKGDTNKDKLEIVNGMKLDTTYTDASFINNMSNKSIEYQDSAIIIIDGKLNDIQTISSILPKTKPCIIIAEDFNESVLGILKNNYNKGIIQVGLVRSPGIGSHRKDLLGDIATYTGATVLEPNTTYVVRSGVVGSMDRVKVDRTSATFYKRDIPEAVSDRIKIIKDYRRSTEDSYEKELCDKRLGLLDAKSTIIKVGGESKLERDERFDRVDDSVRAVTCAIGEGTVIGGGLALKIAVSDCDNLFTECLTKPFNSIFGDIPKEEAYKYIKNNKIIDPFKVTRTALQNAISIAMVLLSTKGIIVNKPGWMN